MLPEYQAFEDYFIKIMKRRPNTWFSITDRMKEQWFIAGYKACKIKNEVE